MCVTSRAGRWGKTFGADQDLADDSVWERGLVKGVLIGPDTRKKMASPARPPASARSAPVLGKPPLGHAIPATAFERVKADPHATESDSSVF